MKDTTLLNETYQANSKFCYMLHHDSHFLIICAFVVNRALTAACNRKRCAYIKLTVVFLTDILLIVVDSTPLQFSICGFPSDIDNMTDT